MGRLKGYIKVKITGHSLERYLNLCSFHRIVIWKLTAVEDGCELCLYAADFKRMKPLLKKTETRIKILQKRGVPFFLFRNRKRKGFFVGGGVCVFLVWLSGKLFSNRRSTDSFSERAGDRTGHEKIRVEVRRDRKRNPEGI